VPGGSLGPRPEKFDGSKDVSSALQAVRSENPSHYHRTGTARAERRERIPVAGDGDRRLPKHAVLAVTRGMRFGAQNGKPHEVLWLQHGQNRPTERDEHGTHGNEAFATGSGRSNPSSRAHGLSRPGCQYRLQSTGREHKRQTPPPKPQKRKTKLSQGFFDPKPNIRNIIGRYFVVFPVRGCRAKWLVRAVRTLGSGKSGTRSGETHHAP